MRKWKGTFAAAARKGREAARAGVDRNKCPYKEHTASNKSGATFSRAWIRAWTQSFDDEKRIMAEESAAIPSSHDLADARASN
jgi:ribosome modulation factor